MSKEQKAYLIGFGLGVLGCLLIWAATANAHYVPCQYDPPQPTCEYVQVVNPTTGLLETHYVCK